MPAISLKKHFPYHAKGQCFFLDAFIFIVYKCSNGSYTALPIKSERRVSSLNLRNYGINFDWLTYL